MSLNIVKIPLRVGDIQIQNNKNIPTARQKPRPSAIALKSVSRVGFFCVLTKRQEKISNAENSNARLLLAFIRLDLSCRCTRFGHERRIVFSGKGIGIYHKTTLSTGVERA